MNERDVVVVPLGPDRKPHPGVVMRVSDRIALIAVLAGTGTARDLPRVVVKAGTRAARAMRLNKDTYFYLSNIVAVPTASASSTGARCPPDVFRQLDEFAGDAIAALGFQRDAKLRG